MANLVNTNTFQTWDDYFTTREIWEKVIHLIPKDKIIWESCMLHAENSKSPQILQELGCDNLIWDTTMDMLVTQPEKYDMIVTNIPFNMKLKIPILRRLLELDKPFLIIMNSMNLYTKYMRKIFGDKLKDLQVINPLGKLQFEKQLGDGSIETNGNCSFYCVFVAYKMNLTNSSLWLLTGKNN
jgi:hypothetical protein